MRETIEINQVVLLKYEKAKRMPLEPPYPVDSPSPDLAEIARELFYWTLSTDRPKPRVFSVKQLSQVFKGIYKRQDIRQVADTFSNWSLECGEDIWLKLSEKGNGKTQTISQVIWWIDD